MRDIIYIHFAFTQCSVSEVQQKPYVAELIPFSQGFSEFNFSSAVLCVWCVLKILCSDLIPCCALWFSIFVGAPLTTLTCNTSFFHSVISNNLLKRNVCANMVKKQNKLHIISLLQILAKTKKSCF